MTKPNILLITSDQQHWNTLGAINSKIRTPALDRLASEGTRFERAYCPNPLCSPSRSSIITGQYPSSHGCWTIGVKLLEDVPTVGEILSSNGYRTGLIGKAHFQPLASSLESTSLECLPTLRDLEFWRGFHGPWYGFDHIELARNHGNSFHAGQHYALWMEEHGFTEWRDCFAPLPPAPNPRLRGRWEIPEEFHYSRWTGERTVAFIESAVEEDRPFLAWASFQDPHPPYVVPDPWASMYDPGEMEPGELVPGEHDNNPPHFRLTQETKPDFSWYQEETGLMSHGFHSHRHDRNKLKEDMATYYGMISLMDSEIGRILDALDRLGIAEDTIVIFTTDHGHFLGQHGLIAKGAFHYEDLVKVPFLVRWPGRVPKGATNASLQSLVDLAPTFLAAAGSDIPRVMQGCNQLPVWLGDLPEVRDHVIVENRHQPTRIHLRTYIDRRYKLTVYRDQPYGELFDLQDDPNETRNLWNDPQAAELKAQLIRAHLNAEIRREPTRMPRIANA